MSSDIFFFQNWVEGALNFCLSVKMVLRKVAGGYKKPYKTQTTWPKWLKYGLKWSQEDNLDDPWCPQTIIFQNWGVGVLNFCLSVKNGFPKIFRSTTQVIKWCFIQWEKSQNIFFELILADGIVKIYW